MSLLIATFPETKHIAKAAAKALNAEYTEIFVEDFPDSEFHIMLKKNPRQKNVVIMSSIIKEVDSKLVETLLAGGIAEDYHAKKVILLATYFPYMRQDKHFIKYDSFSSKHVINLFSNFNKIIAIDPHLHRIKSMKELSYKAESFTVDGLIADYIKKRFKEDFTIIGPDEESIQWSKPIANLLGKEVVILKKIRFSSNKIKQKEIKEKLNKNVIIIDDIISTGRTISGALALAKKHGAKNLYCIGIHGVLVKGADKLITKYAELITTNTIPNKYAKIDITPAVISALRKYA